MQFHVSLLLHHFRLREVLARGVYYTSHKLVFHKKLSKIFRARFFLLHAAKVRSSCEEGPGQSALQSAYHNPKLDVTELKQNRTP